MIKRGWIGAVGALVCVATLSGCARLGIDDDIFSMDEAAPASAAAPAQPAASQADAAVEAARPPLGVGLLLPLSGPRAAYGQNLLDAARLAAAEAPTARRIELLPEDVAGSPAEAAKAAIAAGAEALIGPPAATDAEGAVEAALAAGTPILLATSERRLMAPDVFVAGAAPEAAATRVLDYAFRQGVETVAALTPATPEGDAALRGFGAAAAARGITVVAAGRVPDGANAAAFKASFARLVPAVGDGGAIFLPFPAQSLPAIATALGTGPGPRFILGAPDWDGALLPTLKALQNAIFAGPDPAVTAAFRARYAAAYGTAPVRDAALIYDLTALLAVTGEGKDAISSIDIADPAGFVGVEGPFRPRGDGVVERGLAIVGVSDGRLVVLEPAPDRFEPGT